MSKSALVSSLVEFFTLREAATAASKLDAARRASVVDALAMAKQRGDAAESLWASGHPAEAIRLAVDAHASVARAGSVWLGADSAASGGPVEPASPEAAASPEEPAKPDSEPPPEATSDAAGTNVAIETARPAEAKSASEANTESPIVGALRSRGSSPAALDRAAAVERDLSAARLPLRDADVDASHGDLFDRLTETRATVARLLGEATLPARDLAVRKWTRIITATVLSTATVVGVYVGTRTPEGVHARASATFNDMPDFEPSHVLDGNPDSSWLLPDRTAGWVEVTIQPSRTVHRVRVLNTYNPPYRDRATHEYQIELFANGQAVQTLEGAFDATPNPAWVTHDVGTIEGVDRVRFHVRSWQQYGGGLSELAVE